MAIEIRSRRGLVACVLCLICRDRLINRGARKDSRATRKFSMLDVLMIGMAIGFFALAIGYTYACERL